MLHRFFRGLVFGAEPADFALGFFGGALVVEVDEALEELFFGFLLVFGLFGPGGGGAGAADEFFGEVVPAVGLEDGAVEVVVEFAQDGDQALFVDFFFLVGQGILPGAVFPGRCTCRSW